MFDPATDKYIVIAGHGRSGTNLALDMVNLHPLTNCRNEPNELAGAALSRLPDGYLPNDLPGDFVARWHEALRIAGQSKGGRDRFYCSFKQFYRSTWHVWPLEHGLAHRKIRKILPQPLREEWPIGSFFRDAREFARMIPIFKILLMPRWIMETHDADRQQLVLHVVRDPVGFTRSWFNRYVKGVNGNPEHVFDQNMQHIDMLLAQFGRNFRSGRVYSREALIESELWRWRYMNEILYSALNTSPRYKMMLYRDLVGNRFDAAAEIYDWAGLEMADEVKSHLSSMQNTLFDKPHSHDLPKDMILDIAGHVLKGSSQAPLFEGQPTP